MFNVQKFTLPSLKKNAADSFYVGWEHGCSCGLFISMIHVGFVICLTKVKPPLNTTALYDNVLLKNWVFLPNPD